MYSFDAKETRKLNIEVIYSSKQFALLQILKKNESM